MRSWAVRRFLGETLTRQIPNIMWLAVASCTWSNPWQAQRDYLQSQTPPPIAQSSAPASRTLKVRVWVDRDYQGQTPQWEPRVRAMFARASGLTRGVFGVELEPVAISTWDRAGSSQLEPLLEKLMQQDTGKDVDLVVGFVSALTAFTATYHQLGMAYTPGRYLVLRGIDNAEETDAIVGGLKLIGDEEKLAVIRARKEHKETAVLLHEFGHALAAFHDRDLDHLMSATYAKGQTTFSERSERMIRIGLTHHPAGLDDGVERKAWITEVQPIVDAVPENQWAMGDRDGYLTWLKSDTRPTRPLAEADMKLLSVAIEKMNAGRAADALATARPLVERNPRDERVLGFVCWAAHTLEDCRRACDDGGSTFGCLRVVEFELKAGEDTKARAELRTLEPKIHERRDWTDLAAMYQRAGCLTWAEQASAHAELGADAATVAEWASRQRRWLGAEGLAPEDEGELLSEFQRIGRQLNDHQLVPARAAIAKLRERFSKAPLPRALECELHLRGNAIPAARTACDQALALGPGCGYAHYLTAVTQQTQGRHAEAARHLEAALEIEPGNDDGWERLIDAYVKIGNAPAAETAKKRRAEARKH
jgi:tetratricopeptide (TPR) repeat protein